MPLLPGGGFRGVTMGEGPIIPPQGGSGTAGPSERELVRDYVSPDGRVLRVSVRVPVELLSFPIAAKMIDAYFEAQLASMMKGSTNRRD